MYRFFFKGTNIRKIMNIIDIIILVLLVPSVILGIKKGFISQAASLVGVILGVYLASKMTSAVGAWLTQYISVSDQLLNLISFVIIFVLVCWCLALLGKLLEKVFKVIMLGWLNKLFGAVFSVLTFLVIFSLVVALLNGLNNQFGFLNSSAFADSVLYDLLNRVSGVIMPYLKDLWNTAAPHIQKFSL